MFLSKIIIKSSLEFIWILALFFISWDSSLYYGCLKWDFTYLVGPPVNKCKLRFQIITVKILKCNIFGFQSGCYLLCGPYFVIWRSRAISDVNSRCTNVFLKIRIFSKSIFRGLLKMSLLLLLGGLKAELWLSKHCIFTLNRKLEKNPEKYFTVFNSVHRCFVLLDNFKILCRKNITRWAVEVPQSINCIRLNYDNNCQDQVSWFR